MGLVLGPLVLFWFAAMMFSLRMGYVVLSGKGFFPFIIVVVAVAVIVALAYVSVGLFKFMGRETLWAFEIPFFFAANKVSIALFLSAALVYLFALHHIEQDVVKALLFVVPFSVSTATLMGIFSSDTFIETYNITRTY
ncbi:hypothetical protein CLV44_101216 [Marinobacterium halophilum]|uniref:Uncharacterized protein n=1 Tax=Marinobacterium halophilum TaxID=267374 RepID=A0A2P8F521_9GAMM|nr:hypothetical protein [Marinobacterium halophilum]PSL16816.1 hypothetical protein CLV44_101216 [Marinobacterium halophilum]